MNNVRYAVRTDKNVKFKVNIKTDTVGNNSVSISFGGNSKFIGSRIDTSFNVVKQDFKISVDKINQVYKGEYAIIGGKFTDANGVTIKSTTVKINVNGNVFNAKTNNKGIFTYKYKTDKVGVNNVTVAFAGNSRYKM